MSERLHITPITKADSDAYIREHHRHEGIKPPVQSILRLAVADESGRVRGVATVGRPVARGLQDGLTLEVTRCCTDGARNACSMLYGAAWRAVRALGYRRLVTYILDTEDGASARAAGFRIVATVRGRKWDTPSRRRYDARPPQGKFRMEIECMSREIAGRVRN